MTRIDLKSAKLLKKNIESMIVARERELKELLKQYNEIVHLIDGFPHLNVNNGDKSEQKEIKAKTKSNSDKREVAAGAYKLVKMRGKPIKRDELYDLLIAQGYVIEGKNPQMILSTMLWRVKDSGLIRLNGGGYWIKDQRYAPADYYPQVKTLKSNNSNQMDLINHLTH